MSETDSIFTGLTVELVDEGLMELENEFDLIFDERMGRWPIIEYTEPDLLSYSRPLTPEPPNCEWHYPHYYSQPMDPEPPEVDDEDDVDELLREDREVMAAEKRAYEPPPSTWDKFYLKLVVDHQSTKRPRTWLEIRRTQDDATRRRIWSKNR
jgi:hypothetical protein